MNKIVIDGSVGEGGGQIFRSSLTLSLLTKKPLQIHNIRSKRSSPGLKQQHLTALKAAAEISNAQVEGDFSGSQEVLFIPGEIKPGNYSFKIPTAGSTALVLQTIFMPWDACSLESSLPLFGMAVASLDGTDRLSGQGRTAPMRILSCRWRTIELCYIIG